MRGSWVCDRLTEIGGEVNDEFAVNDEIVVALFEIQGEHFLGSA